MAICQLFLVHIGSLLQLSYKIITELFCSEAFGGLLHATAICEPVA